MNTKLLSTVIGITLLASPIIAIAQIDTGDTTTSTTGIISTLEHLLVSLTAELNALLASRPTSPDGQLATAIIGTVATPSQVPAFPTTRTAFFTDLYQCILGRAPDAGGLAYWVAQPSTMTLGSIYQTWFTSPEYLSRATSNQTFMTQVYNCILFRQADLNGYNGWVKGLQSGATRSAVVRSSVSSSEFLTSQGPKLSTATGFTLSTTTMSIAKPTTSITADNTNITVGQSTSIHASFTAGSGDTVTTTAINQPYGTTVVGGGSVWGTPLVNPLSYTFKPTAPGTYNFYSFVQTKSYPSWYAVTPATVTVNVSTTSSRNIPFAYYYSEQNVAAAAGIANTVLVTAKYDDVIKGSPYVLNELAQAKSHDLDVIIIISDIFFNSDYSLRSGGNIAFSQLWNSIQSYKSSVRGFYLPDEPFSQLYNMRANGKSTVTYMQLSQYLDTISAYIHTTVASIPTILIFAQGDVGLSNFYNTYLPRSVDWIGYDCYLSNGCTDQTVESALDMMVQSKAANQKIVIVPDANWTSVPNDLIDSQVASRVQLYENWYATHQSQVAAVLPFSFGGTIAVNGWVGIGSGSLPKTTAELLHFFTDTSLSTSSPVPTISMSASAASVAVGTPITITANFIPGLGDAVVVDAINEIPPSGVQFTPVYTGTGGVVLKNPLSYTFTTTTPGTYVFKPEVMTSKYPAWTTSDPSQWITVIVHQATIDSRISVANASGLYPDWGAADLVKNSGQNSLPSGQG